MTITIATIAAPAWFAEAPRSSQPAYRDQAGDADQALTRRNV